MKNLYKITKGQLITIWIFGLIGFITSSEQADYSSFATFISISIPAVLIFYTLGWRHNNKTKLDASVSEQKNLNILPSKKVILNVFSILSIIIIILFSLSFFANKRQENLEKQQLNQKYDQAISSIDNLEAQFTSCMQPAISKKYEEELRSCNLLKNKVRANYDTCLTYTMVSPRASCLYDYDYESIDCTEEAMERKAKLATLNNIPTQCKPVFLDYMSAKNTIKEYEELN